MYQITCDDDILYDLRIDRKVINPKLTLELNKAGSLIFTMPVNNLCKINLLTSIIKVFRDGEKIFEGRPLNNKKDFYNNGRVECEGELAYLNDSIIRPYEEHDITVENYLKLLLNNHNSSVQNSKKFEIGTITVKDSNNSLYRKSEKYINTLYEINTKLVERLGGYLKIRYENDGKRYLDYLTNLDHVNTQKIEFSKNMLDITQFLNGENIKTAIIPTGKDGLTITDVNNGKDYIYSNIGTNLYGWIWDVVEFPDVTIAANLKNKAQQYLENIINLALTLELNAIDLSLIDVNIEKIKLGDWIQVVSKPHGLNRNFLVKKMILNLDRPDTDTISLGDTIIGLADKQIKDKKNINNNLSTTEVEVARINTTVVQNTQNINNTNISLEKQKKYYIMGV